MKDAADYVKRKAGESPKRVREAYGYVKSKGKDARGYIRRKTPSRIVRAGDYILKKFKSPKKVQVKV